MKMLARLKYRPRSRSRASDGFFAGPTDNVEITDSTINHTLGNYTIQNVTINHVNCTFCPLASSSLVSVKACSHLPSAERRGAENDAPHQYPAAVPVIIEELSGLLSTEPREGNNTPQQHLFPPVWFFVLLRIAYSNTIFLVFIAIANVTP